MASCRVALHRLPLRIPLPSSFVSASRISSLSRHSPPGAFAVRSSFPRFQIQGMYSESKLKGATQQKEDQLSNKWKIKMLYDGECPLCMREVNMLRERNQAYGTIKFIDISSEYFSPAENQGLDYKTVMGRIHAIQSDGTVYTDVEAFRRLYEEVGLGWVYAITKYEPGDEEPVALQAIEFWSSICDKWCDDGLPGNNKNNRNLCCKKISFNPLQQASKDWRRTPWASFEKGLHRTILPLSI